MLSLCSRPHAFGHVWCGKYRARIEARKVPLAQGRTVDFKNTVIVMTSNVGSEAISMLNDAESVEAAVKARSFLSSKRRL